MRTHLKHFKETQHVKNTKENVNCDYCLHSGSAYRCRPRPVPCFPSSRKDRWPRCSAEPWADPDPPSNKGWLSQKPFCQTERNQIEELFRECAVSLPPFHPSLFSLSSVSKATELRTAQEEMSGQLGVQLGDEEEPGEGPALQPQPLHLPQIN